MLILYLKCYPIELYYKQEEMQLRVCVIVDIVETVVDTFDEICGSLLLTMYIKQNSAYCDTLFHHRIPVRILFCCFMLLIQLP